jgi:hypothetical protein
VLSVTALLAACLGVACAGSDALLGPDAAQGIAGLVLLGPLCPVVYPDNSCPDRPYAARIEVYDGGRRVTTVESGDDGTFRVGLGPGAYRLHPLSPSSPLPRAQDQDVTVPVGVWVDVTVSYDTGIR